jgi:3-dehydroquinate synthase
VRATLNFGHTFGHAIETGTHYRQWLHGEAVALGMLMAVRFSEEVGLLSQSLMGPLEQLLKKAQLPTEWPRLGGENMLQWMGMDKKVLQSKIRLVLLSDIGAPIVSAAYSDERLLKFLKAHCDPSV